MGFLSRAVSVALVCVVCGACSLSESVFPDPEPNPPDFKATADEIRLIYEKLKLVGRPEVSDVHRNRAPFPADWALCLRNDDAASRQYYTLFFRNKKIADYRLSVLADACEGDTFTPLQR